MCSCGGKKTPASKIPSSTLTSSGNFTNESLAKVIKQSNDKEKMKVLEYIGPLRETFFIRGRFLVDGMFMKYRFGNNDYHRFQTVLREDAEWLLEMNDQNSRPLYRIVGTGGAQEVNDPAAFLGQPITA